MSYAKQWLVMDEATSKVLVRKLRLDAALDAAKRVVTAGVTQRVLVYELMHVYVPEAKEIPLVVKDDPI